MDELIQQLQTRIKNLSQYCENLKLTNLKLIESESILKQEKEVLLVKYNQAVSQIERMLSGLKSLESTS